MVTASVEFEVKPEHVAEFRKAMLQQTRDSLKNEPGLRQFDVNFDPKDDRKVFLYEVYDAASDWEAHLTAAHSKSFFSVTEKWLVSKKFRTWERADLK